MERFGRYLTVIIGVIVITCLLIFSQDLLGSENGEDIGSSSISSEQIAGEESSSQNSNELEDSSEEFVGNNSSNTETEHQHQAIDAWVFDTTLHWKECACEEKLEVGLHVYETCNDSNTDSGYIKECFCGYKTEIGKVVLTDLQKLDLSLKVDDGNACLNEERYVSVSLGEKIGSVQFVKYNGKELQCAVSGENIILKASCFGFDYGNTQLEILTSEHYYQVPILLITKQIATARDLDEINVLSKKCEDKDDVYGGYFTLGNNIAYNSEWQGGIATKIKESLAVAGKVGFCGVFDGCGYSIDGLLQNGKGVFDAFIGVLCGGMIKNIAFTNAGLLHSGGFVCAAGVGIIENVYVQYAQFGSDDNDNNFFGTFFGSWVGNGAVVNDCIVDILDTEDIILNTNGYLIGCMINVDFEQEGALDGVFVLGVSPFAKLVYDVDRKGCGGYQQEENFKNDTEAQEEILAWDTEYWIIENGLVEFIIK